MFKMPHADHGHGQLVFAAVFYGVFVAHRTTGLDESCDTCLVANLYTVVEREEGITGHYGAVQVKCKLFYFFNGMAQGIYALNFPWQGTLTTQTCPARGIP